MDNTLKLLKEQNLYTLGIPSPKGGTIEIIVQKPSMFELSSLGEIPNPLIEIVHSQVFGSEIQEKQEKERSKEKTDKEKEEELLKLSKMVETYAKAVMVKPTFDEAYHLLTDDQIATIYAFAMGATEDIIPSNKE